MPNASWSFAYPSAVYTEIAARFSSITRVAHRAFTDSSKFGSANCGDKFQKTLILNWSEAT
jgi:hypothetical protein